MCNILVVYTGNMLCMDLCGTSRVEAKKLVGCKLLEFLESQQLGGLVWGCRHQLEVSTDCMYYHKRRSRLLSDRYEPVTRHMCTRINNVAACLHFLEHYHQQLLKALNIVVGSSSSSSSEEEGEEVEGDAGDGMELSFSSDDGVDSAFDATGTQNNTGASEEFVYVSHSTDQPEVDSLSGSLYGEEDQVVRRWTYQSQQALDGAREHIMSVLTALCRLLAFRLNLFVGDGLPLLLQLKQPEASLPSCLAPITTFLQRYLDSLSTWLYQHCFTRVLHNLWIFMVQDIEKQTDLLRLSGTAANSQAHTWMMVVSFLMKFMNNNGKGIKKDLLLSQANEAIFKLQLYTLSTWHLIALFQSLREYYTEGDHLSLEENQSRSPPAVVHRIHRELQALRKCFSGAELVHWIIKNKDALPADLSLPPGPVDREVAISISQLLVDRQFILDTDSDCSTGSHSPVSITGMDAMSPYPQLSVHSHAFSDYEYDDRRSSALRSHVFSDYDYDNRRSSAPRSGSHSSDSSTRENSEVEVLVHCDEDRTPTGEVVADNRDPVLDSNSHDTTLRRRSSPPFPLNATDGLPAPPLPSQSPPALATSFSQSLSISDFRPLALQAERRLRQRTRDSGSGDSLFDTERRLTPFSNLNEQTLTRGTRFVPSSRKFYVVQQNLVPAGLASPEQTDPRSAGGLTEGEREFLKLKSSPESRELLEQCVVHKVGPLSILAIVAARRKTDSTSKNFMKKLPKHLLDKVNNLLDEPGMDCRSS
ncbi:uncharacterized protein LOC101863232 [Aplysia californica]|uniref:Uncharacterized protein LOC101863232 n=1 Tax=Aplysia californica TaxID=6500 RepID=A0ABM1AED3_APLCA|nr:uncharacterized protein LOC101863232 [Aplysia californica]